MNDITLEEAIDTIANLSVELVPNGNKIGDTANAISKKFNIPQEDVLIMIFKAIDEKRAKK